MRFRSITCRCRCGRRARRGVSRVGADHAERGLRRRPEHGRLRHQLSRAEIRADEPGGEGARGRHRSRRLGVAEDLRKAVGAAEGRHRGLGRRRRGRPSAGRGDDGQRKAADGVPQRRRGRQARLARHGEERARRQRRRLRAADVPQPDRVRLQPRPREVPAEVLRGAHRVGEEEPEAVRLQRRQGRHVGRRLRDGLGVRELGPRRQAGEGPVRRRPTRRRSRSRWPASRNSTRAS